jgi:uncharacterized sporulation protein YeaH/YhbH (DUF444 family)
MKKDPSIYHQQPFSTENIYARSDLNRLQDVSPPKATYIHSLSSIDELLERDKQRERDGFPKKIRIGRLIKPGRGEKGKIVLVPTTVEEKFVHDNRTEASDKPDATGGSGEGGEGEVIGQEPIHGTDGSGTGGAGKGQGGDHDLESSAYDLGRILTERFELPNLKDKGKKSSLTRYHYDLTDRHRGSGQILDKKATLRRILDTNIHLKTISHEDEIDPTHLLVSPKDMVYRILSKERDYQSKAMVFFLRDYSGSMTGKPTEIIVTQHVLIYSWLLYQYEKQVETRFILHDTEAKEVPDFYTYYNSSVAGGTRVASAYHLVNEIIEAENLDRDYNIYVFHGTDGDDWDSDGAETIPDLKKMIAYSNRVGITISERASGPTQSSTVEKNIKKSKLLEEFPRQIRVDPVREDVAEERLILGIKNLIS